MRVPKGARSAATQSPRGGAGETERERSSKRIRKVEHGEAQGKIKVIAFTSTTNSAT